MTLRTLAIATLAAAAMLATPTAAAASSACIAVGTRPTLFVDESLVLANGTVARDSTHRCSRSFAVRVSLQMLTARGWIAYNAPQNCAFTGQRYPDRPWSCSYFLVCPGQIHYFRSRLEATNNAFDAVGWSRPRRIC